MFAPYTATALPRTPSPSARERSPKAEANWLDSSIDLQRGLTVLELPLAADDPVWALWLAPVLDLSRR